MPDTTNRAAFQDSVAGMSASRTPSQREIPSDPCHCAASRIRTSDIRPYVQYTHLLQWTPDNTPAHDGSEVTVSGLNNQARNSDSPHCTLQLSIEQPYPDYLLARRYMAMQGGTSSYMSGSSGDRIVVVAHAGLRRSCWAMASDCIISRILPRWKRTALPPRFTYGYETTSANGEKQAWSPCPGLARHDEQEIALRRFNGSIGT